MTVFGTKSAFLAAALAAAAVVAPASASQSASLFNQDSTGFQRDRTLDGAFLLANQICAQGADVMALVSNAPIDAAQKAIALGEAARQLTAVPGQCKATQGAIDSALAMVKGSGDANALQLAYDQQRTSGGQGQGDGIAGLNALGGTRIGSSVVSSGPGANLSPR